METLNSEVVYKNAGFVKSNFFFLVFPYNILNFLKVIPLRIHSLSNTNIIELASEQIQIVLLVTP